MEQVQLNGTAKFYFYFMNSLISLRLTALPLSSISASTDKALSGSTAGTAFPDQMLSSLLM